MLWIKLSKRKHYETWTGECRMTNCKANIYFNPMNIIIRPKFTIENLDCNMPEWIGSKFFHFVISSKDFKCKNTFCLYDENHICPNKNIIFSSLENGIIFYSLKKCQEEAEKWIKKNIKSCEF